MDRRNNPERFSSFSFSATFPLDTREVTLRASGPLQLNHAYRSFRAVFPAG